MRLVVTPAWFPNSRHYASSLPVANLRDYARVSKTECVAAPNFLLKKNAFVARWPNSIPRSCRSRQNSPLWVATTLAMASRRTSLCSSRPVVCRQCSPNVVVVSIAFVVHRSIKALLHRSRLKRHDLPPNSPRSKPNQKSSNHSLPNSPRPRNFSLPNAWSSKSSGRVACLLPQVLLPRFVVNSPHFVLLRVVRVKNAIASQLAPLHWPTRQRRSSPKQNRSAPSSSSWNPRNFRSSKPWKRLKRVGHRPRPQFKRPKLCIVPPKAKRTPGARGSKHWPSPSTKRVHALVPSVSQASTVFSARFSTLSTSTQAGKPHSKLLWARHSLPLLSMVSTLVVVRLKR